MKMLKESLLKPGFYAAYLLIIKSYNIYNQILQKWQIVKNYCGNKSLQKKMMLS